VTSKKAAALAEHAGQLVSNATNIGLPQARRKSRKTVLNSRALASFKTTGAPPFDSRGGVAGRRGAPGVRSAESRSNK